MALIDVPLTGQNLDQTRNPIRNNFLSINNAFLVDHVTYNGVGQGKHNKVTMPNQALAPVFTPPEIGLYNFVNPTSTVNELYVSKSNGTQVPMTASQQATTGWCYLPSGVLLKWGVANANLNAFTTINFPVGATIPNFVNVFSIQVTTGTPNAGNYNQVVILNTTNITSAGFEVFNRQIVGVPPATSSQITYFAIGN